VLGCALTQCLWLRTVVLVPAALLAGSSDPVAGAELGAAIRRPLEQISEIELLVRASFRIILIPLTSSPPGSGRACC
jgi:hypothetical protein